MKTKKEKKYVVDMTVGNPVKLILTFMLPMLLGNVFQQFYSMVDSIIVGQFVGADALAAVGATGSINFLFFSLTLGMSTGAGVIISHHFGAGEENEVKKTICNAGYLMLFTGALTALISFMAARPILVALNTPANILDDAVIYMRIICGGVIATAMYNGISSMLRAVGDSKTPLYFLIVSSALNIILDLLFVRGINMGVAGAALATIISQFIAGGGASIFAFSKNPYFKMQKEYLKVNYAKIHQVLKIGLPLAAQTSFIAVSCILLQRVVNGYGSTVVATFTATSRIEQLIQQPFNSLGSAISTYTGQNLGAGHMDRVKKGFVSGEVTVLIICAIMIPVMFLFGGGIVSWFVSEIEVITLGRTAIKITAAFFPALGTIYVCRGLLNGAGDATYSFLNGIYEMVGRVAFPKPLTMIPAIGVWGVWLATGFTWALVASLSFARYATGHWKKKIGII